MQVHSTNYYNTFIEVAEDCPSEVGLEPVLRAGKKTIALYQFDLLKAHPYQFTSDEVFFKVLALRKGFAEGEMEGEKEAFFSRGQPCFRASPLTKKFGWGIHCDQEGKAALYARESDSYRAFLEDERIKKVKAMRSRRK